MNVIVYLKSTAEKHGATILDGVQVQHVTAQQGRVLVQTEATTFTTDSVVICPGPWANEWMKKLNINLQFEVKNMKKKQTKI